jgi:hypothetical protein
MWYIKLLQFSLSPQPIVGLPYDIDISKERGARRYVDRVLRRINYSPNAFLQISW